jgi:hypothetical protein
VFALLAAAGSLLLNVKLTGLLDDVVAGTCDMDGWIAGLSVLLDGIAALRLDGYLAMLFGFSDLAARCARAPIP